MGVPVWPLAAAYGLGLGHLAGQGFYNRYMSPTAGNQLTTWSHPSNTTTIKANGAQTSTARMMKRGRSYTRTQTRRRRRGRFGRRRNYPRKTSFPWKMVRVLKTVKYISLNPGAAGAIATATFLINSANDPTGASGSGQPLGFDQMASVYERYAVIGAKIFVECTSAEATHPIAVGLHAEKDSSALTSYEHYKELPSTQMRLMTPEQDKVTMALKVPISRLYGHRKFLSDNRLSAYTTADPDDKAYIHVFAQPVDQTTDVGVVHLVCTIYQTIVFYTPRVLARS